MPFIWTKIPSSPPRERRDEVREICRRHGARLCENQTYYAGGIAHALIEVDGNDAEARALLEELGAYDVVVLVDADEQADLAALEPPPESAA